MSVVQENEANLENQCDKNPNLEEVKEKKSEGKDSPTGDILDEQKHQLQNMWRFWYFEESIKQKSWDDSLIAMSPFTTIQGFWSVFNYLESASKMRSGCSYYVFKEGIKPNLMWDDAGNRKGGRWLINFEPKYRKLLGDKWLKVLLCLIGDSFGEDGDDICGAVIDVRHRVDRIFVWTADCKNKDRIMNIGRKIKEHLLLEPDAQITYESHLDTANKNSSSAKHIFKL